MSSPFRSNTHASHADDHRHLPLATVAGTGVHAVAVRDAGGEPHAQAVGMHENAGAVTTGTASRALAAGAAALRAWHLAPHRHDHRGAANRVGEIDLRRCLERRRCRRAPAAAHPLEEVAEQAAEIGEPAEVAQVEVDRTAVLRTPRAGMACGDLLLVDGAEAIVLLPLGLVGEDGVRLLHLAKPLLSVLLPRVDIG